jgi:signal transduction histidine kinase
LSAGDSQQLLASILEECERLTRLTDQLLALSREDAGLRQSLRETVELGSLVESVVETMRPAAMAKELDFRSSPNGQIFVIGDEGRLRQVFYNLLDNAIKYTPEGGEIEVTLGRTDGTAVVEVRDSGIGISAEDVPRVFDRFYRVDKARSREQGGTGLGLSIAQTIVHGHGGKIELASTRGKGSTFTVTLPVEQNE